MGGAPSYSPASDLDEKGSYSVGTEGTAYPGQKASQGKGWYKLVQATSSTFDVSASPSSLEAEVAQGKCMFY